MKDTVLDPNKIPVAIMLPDGKYHFITYDNTKPPISPEELNFSLDLPGGIKIKKTKKYLYFVWKGLNQMIE